jgi:mono/diheme cytochrome c family protein
MRKGLFVGSILGLIILAACNAGTSYNAKPTAIPVPTEYAGLTNPLPADAATAAEGAEVFRINCAPCHGKLGHGDGPAGAALDPAPKDLSDLHPVVGDDYLFWRINTGKPGTSMVAWQGILDDEEIWQVVTFIRTLK